MIFNYATSSSMLFNGTWLGKLLQYLTIQIQDLACSLEHGQKHMRILD
jgi:hypothetical protein